MKKPLKITLISLGSILAIVFIAIAVAVWFVFTPKKLTPIVRDVLQKNIKCQTQLEEVELTFFSTFPNFEINVNKILLKNPVSGSQSDTLLYINNLLGTIDPLRFVFDKELIINELELQKGVINLYTDSTGMTNFDIFPTDSTQKDTASFKLPFDFIDIKRIGLENLEVSYIDRQSGINSQIKNLNLSLEAMLNQLNGNADVEIKTGDIWFNMADSSDLDVSMKTLTLNIEGNKNNNNVTGEIKSAIGSLNVSQGKNKLVENRDITLNMPITVDLASLMVTLKEGSFIDFAKNKITLNGWIKRLKGLVDMDLKFNTDLLQIGDIISLMPDNMKGTFANMKVEGKIDVEGVIKGKLQGDTIPEILANINIEDTKYSQKGLPLALRDINGQIQANIGSSAISDLRLNKIRLKAGKSSAVVDGSINDLTGKQMCALNINGNIDFDDIKAFLPDSMSLKGVAKTNLSGTFALDDIANVNMKKIKLKGNMNTQNLFFVYKDSTSINMPKANIGITIPSSQINTKFAELINVVIDNSEVLDFEQIGAIKANIKNPKMNIGISDITDTKQPMSVRCSYDIDNLNIALDTINATVAKPNGDFCMIPSKKNKDLSTYMVNIASSGLDIKYGKNVNIASSTINLGGDITYQANEEDAFLKFLPNFNVQINQIDLITNKLKDNTKIPVIDFILTPDNLTINKSRFVLKNSDFNITGVVTNIADYLKNSGMLKADLEIKSDMININEIMDLASGFGAKNAEQKKILEEKPKDGDKEPFMVPWNIDLTLTTNVSHGKISTTDIYDLGGKLIIKDGVLVLEQMGFTSEAAKMQLTSIYRSERKNHLFVSLDFHLLDIEIDKLIKMIPQIDTIVPMLRYFSGKGEFHLAAETYLNSNYNIKYSTIRGASAFEGKNLTLLDNETFNSIAKKLRFNKKTQNKIDSLSVELTLFRDEVELFPFLLAMDNYEVVLQGKYNLAKNYMFKAEAISPIRIGVEIIKSNESNKLKLSKLKLLNLQYTNLFKPEKQNATQRQVMEMKKTISDALKANVKPQ